MTDMTDFPGIRALTRAHTHTGGRGTGIPVRSVMSVMSVMHRRGHPKISPEKCLGFLPIGNASTDTNPASMGDCRYGSTPMLRGSIMTEIRNLSRIVPHCPGSGAKSGTVQNVVINDEFGVSSDLSRMSRIFPRKELSRARLAGEPEKAGHPGQPGQTPENHDFAAMPDDDGELRQEPLRRRPDHDHPFNGDHHG